MNETTAACHDIASDMRFGVAFVAGLLAASSAFTLPHGSRSRCAICTRASARASTLQLALAGSTDLAPGDDLYAILGVSPSASDAEIRLAYRKRARIIHPDVNSAADAARDFRRLSAATEILLSPQRREGWHSEGVAEWPMESPQAYPSSRGPEGSAEWVTMTKRWGPVWSAVIGPWLSWHLFVAIDSF